MISTIAALIAFGLPLTFFILFFIGIVRKKKRLWVTSLIFFILIVIGEIGCFVPGKVIKIESGSAQSK